MRQLRAPLVAVAVIALAAAACGGSTGPSGAKTAYRLFYAGDLSGPTSGAGLPMLSGASAYVDYTNKHSGGVRGHRLTLSTLDDGFDPSKAKINIQQVANLGGLAIIGANGSNGWSPNVAYINQTQIPTLGLGFTDPQLDPPNNTFVYGLSPSYQQITDLQFALIKDVLIKNGSLPAKPRVALYHYTSAAITDQSAIQRHLLDQNGWPLTTEQSFAAAPTDVSAQAAAVVASKPDLVLAIVIDSNAPLAVKTLREKGFTGPVVTGVGASAAATFNAIGDANFYAQVHFLPTSATDQPGVSDVVKRAKEMGDTQYMDATYFTYGWAIAAAVTAALDKCADPCSPVKLNNALDHLGKVNTNGLNPDAGFSPTNHRLAEAGLYFHLDKAKNAPEPIGDWTKVGQ